MLCACSHVRANMLRLHCPLWLVPLLLTFTPSCLPPSRRLLLDCAGPLPQYHPTFLAALLLSGKRAVAAAVFQRLAAWLSALQQQADAGLEAAALPPPSPGVPVAADGSRSKVVDEPAACFAGKPSCQGLFASLRICIKGARKQPGPCCPQLVPAG